MLCGWEVFGCGYILRQQARSMDGRSSGVDIFNDSKHPRWMKGLRVRTETPVLVCATERTVCRDGADAVSLFH
jgi:hypothetical protein